MEKGYRVDKMKDKQEKATQNKGDTQFATDTSQRSLVDWGKALLILFVGLAVAHLGGYVVSAVGSGD